MAKKTTAQQPKVKTLPQKENTLSNVVKNETPQLNDTFLGINKKHFLFAFVGVGISVVFFLLLAISFKNLAQSLLLLMLLMLLLLYTFPIAPVLSKINLKNFHTISKTDLKSVLHLFRNGFVWTASFILIVIFWLYLISTTLWNLRRFYNAFPIFCDIYKIESYSSPLSQDLIILTSILVISFYFLFAYLYKKAEKYKPQNKKPFYNITFNGIKIIFCFLLSSAVSFAILLSSQYTIKKISGISFCKSYPTQSHNRRNSLMNKAKPIIYLYPTETTNISVKLGAPKKLTHTYPKYVDGWQVQAEPNGNLTDTNGRHYYALYWEGKDTLLPQYNDGFVVAKDEITPFLEEKLAELGLNEREANEFIIYWLPKLESSPYTFIHFISMDEQNKGMPLDIKPQPDTVIRVLMAFKNLNKPIEVKEQILPATPQRTGFTVIEWGGTEIDSDIIK